MTVPPIISALGKATNFKFGTRIHGPCEQKPLKIRRKGSMGVSRHCPKFLSTPLLSQERVKL